MRQAGDIYNCVMNSHRVFVNIVRHIQDQQKLIVQTYRTSK